MNNEIKDRCLNCPPEDHDENGFCRCEMRNVEWAEKRRKCGINVWGNVKNNEWIRSKDQRPKDGQYVLAVWMPKGMIATVARGYFPGTMYVVKYEDEEFNIPRVYNPLPATHWMPLPELPGEN